MKTLIKCILLVCYYFIKEKILCIKPKVKPVKIDGTKTSMGAFINLK